MLSLLHEVLTIKYFQGCQFMVFIQFKGAFSCNLKTVFYILDNQLIEGKIIKNYDLIQIKSSNATKEQFEESLEDVQVLKKIKKFMFARL